MNKTILLLLAVLPLAAISQKIKVNNYDKFVKQRVIETSTSNLKYGRTAGMFISLKAVDDDYFAVVKGYGLGNTSGNSKDEITFMLEGNEMLTLTAAKEPYFDAGKTGLYIYEYPLTANDLQLLSNHALKAVKKEAGNAISLTVPPAKQTETKKLSNLLLKELPKQAVAVAEQTTPVTEPAQAVAVAENNESTVNLEEVASHVGKNVSVCGKIFTGRYLSYANNKPTLLNMGAAYPNQLLTVVIYGNDRTNFSEAPESFYMNKEVCVTGKVEMYNNKPQIVIHNKEQINVR